MSQRGITLASKYRLLMSLTGFQSDNEFLDNFDPNNIIHQQIQAVRIAFFEEAKRAYNFV